MTVMYKTVTWNRHKVIYDAVMIASTMLFVGIFVGVGMLNHRGDHALSVPILLIRALGTAALGMLTVALSIGPLARLNTMFAPLLYNRRHLGVATFVVALLHAILVVGFYGAFGDRNPIAAVLAGDLGNRSLSDYPFELLGFAGLLILFIMAATSHDFWLANLTPGVWKAIHMFVYLAFGLIVGHVALGALQSERSIALAALLGLAVFVVFSLHITTAVREWRRDARGLRSDGGSWIDVGAIDELREGKGKVVCLAGGERVALFRVDGVITGMSNVCPHQGGPLGEGQIVNGCVTCPWHGHQFDPTTGQAPPPYTDTAAMFKVRLADQRILLDTTPLQRSHSPEHADIDKLDGGAG
jgi:nitrite reductase/ring-hydroxylating ferredoxin subunit/DMSO/TMAO reductase YedYZ heme-binding membrane subunit